MIGAQILLECLEREGVSRRFGKGGRDAGAKII